MKDYYQVLGVRQGAGLPEIRRAYRVLVQKLHPDVNPDPAAHELIKEVNEAYDVLGDPTKKQEYDYRLNNPYTAVNVSQEPVHRDPAYRSRRTYQPPAPSAQYQLMTKLMPSVKWFAWIGCAICFLLLIDFIIPHRTIQDTTEFYQRGYGRSRSVFILTASGRELKVDAKDALLFSGNKIIEIEESVILSELIEIRIPSKEVRITNLSSIYQNFKFVPALFTILSLLGATGKGSVEFRFNVGIINFFVLIFTIILLLK